jgi:cell division septation protein DedD
MIESTDPQPMEDEGLHEFQLHGKQLVFVVMTATVVAVAIFLCGVMVGRGVPPQRSAASVQAGMVDPIDAAPSVSPLPEGGSAAADLDVPVEPRYGELLEPPDPVAEDALEKPSSPAVVATTASRESRSRAGATAGKTPLRDAGTGARNANRGAAASDASGAEPLLRQDSAAASAALPAPAKAARGSGFVVQVSAVKGQAEADTIRRRLEGKGYPAYIEGTGSGRSAVFRVRVGRYDSRKAAESIAARLQREERFKTWITR